VISEKSAPESISDFSQIVAIFLKIYKILIFFKNFSNFIISIQSVKLFLKFQNYSKNNTSAVTFLPPPAVSQREHYVNISRIPRWSQPFYLRLRCFFHVFPAIRNLTVSLFRKPPIHIMVQQQSIKSKISEPWGSPKNQKILTLHTSRLSPFSQAMVFPYSYILTGCRSEGTLSCLTA
jgi:hypothetical protein